MLPRNSRRRCAALGLLTALALHPTIGYAASSSRALARSPSLWAWLARTVQCALAPGGCVAPQVPAGGLGLDAGCEIDPSGIACRRNAQTSLDAGCELDPSGCLKN
jgi:hypothetical protein